jgi:hypothetical protein
VKKLIAFLAVVALATPAFALPMVEATSMDNGDGTTTYWLTITPMTPDGEVSFLEMWIQGDLEQHQGGAIYGAISSAAWKPNIVFSSEANVAKNVDGGFYADVADRDTVIDDSNWPGKVSVELVPSDGVAGTQMVHVALTSFTGGVGGPLPGGAIPLAHITARGDVWVSGVLQSDSDQDGSFAWHSDVPEPSTVALAVFGLMGLVAGSRRRRS